VYIGLLLWFNLHHLAPNGIYQTIMPEYIARIDSKDLQLYKDNIIKVEKLHISQLKLLNAGTEK